MYRRELDGEVLTFGHAGILYQNSFVMYDKQTDSLWVHATGRAETGPMKGKTLTFFPSTVTTWEQWRAAYPHTTVLPGYRRGGFMGTYKGINRSWGLGLSLIVRFDAKLYPFGALKDEPIVNDNFNGEDVLVFYSDRAGTATAWGRKVDGRVLTFRASDKKDRFGNPLLRDDQTGSDWSWLTGEAVAGDLKGKLLERLMYNPTLNDRFRAFYPDGLIYGG